MRRTMFGLLLASSVMATPAMARDGQAYGGISGGILFGDNLGVDLDVDDDAVFDDNEREILTFNTKRGWEVDGVIGYDFGGFRLEAEGAYKRANIDEVDAVAGFDVDPDLAGVQTNAAVDGNVNVKSLMLNAMADLGADDGVQFFAGGGLGYAWAGLDGALQDDTDVFVDDSDGSWAWQLLGGVRFPLSDSMELGAKYKYFNVENLNMFSPNDDRFETDFKSHSVLATLTFNFGGRTPLPPPPPPVRTAPPPPPPPPPPVQMQTCWNGTRIPANQVCPARPPAPTPQGERG